MSVATMFFVHVGPRGAKHFRIAYLTNETPIKMDTITTGRDVKATDIVAARSMGLDPTEIAHIRMVHEKGLVNIDDIDILGCNIEDGASAFLFKLTWMLLNFFWVFRSPVWRIP